MMASRIIYTEVTLRKVKSVMSRMSKEKYLLEFETMVSEISSKDGTSYNALYRIAEHFLKPYIKKLCYNNAVLRNLNLADDIFHDALVEIIKGCVDKFLYRDGVLNNDPEGFLKWMYTVARNIVVDCSKKHGAKSYNEMSIVNDEGETVDIPSQSNPLIAIETREMLTECFKAAIHMDCELHIIFAWVLRAIVLSKCDLNTVEVGKKDELIENKANEIVVTTFQNLTMSEIYTVIVLESAHLPWMVITESDDREILSKLAQVKNGVVLGDRVYNSFFMKKGGKATISDWVYRMNQRILKALNLNEDWKGVL